MMSLDQFRILDRNNVDAAIAWYQAAIAAIGLPGQHTGVELFRTLKRVPVGSGPYPEATFFEAANRIMTDLVILHGVKWLLENHAPAFEAFSVDYGHRDTQSHDVMSHPIVAGVPSLEGEAFNVAQSFFQGKKTSSLKKLRKKSSASHRFIIVNAEAVKDVYMPDLADGEYILLVDIFGNGTRILRGKLLRSPVLV